VKIASHPGIRSDLFNRPLDKVKVTDFFGNVQNVELTKKRYPLQEEFTEVLYLYISTHYTLY
jgi:phosphatidylinositol glycan class K